MFMEHIGCFVGCIGIFLMGFGFFTINLSAFVWGMVLGGIIGPLISTCTTNKGATSNSTYSTTNNNYNESNNDYYSNESPQIDPTLGTIAAGVALGSVASHMISESWDKAAQRRTDTIRKNIDSHKDNNKDDKK